MVNFTVLMKGMDYKDVRRAKMGGLVVLAMLVLGAVSWGVAACAQSVMAVSASDSIIRVDNDEVCGMLNEDSFSDRYCRHLGEMPGGGRRLSYKPIKGLSRVFNDSNYIQLQAATALGVEPVGSLRGAWKLRRPIVKIASCRDYYVDTLRHSMPFLVPEAEALLREIGRAFNDSLRARGGGDYRIKVTSVLRTPSTIARLRRRNRNAVDSSAHQYGTTFDISYMKFICDSRRMPRTQADLKGLLAEILADFREKGRCYVKHERKQACFHITTRGAGDFIKNHNDTLVEI